MAPLRGKAKFLPQSMTITKCFERQREKLQSKLEESPTISQLQHTPNLIKEKNTDFGEIKTVPEGGRDAEVNIINQASTINSCIRGRVNGHTDYRDDTAHATPLAANRDSPLALKLPVKSARRNLTLFMNECVHANTNPQEKRRKPRCSLQRGPSPPIVTKEKDVTEDESRGGIYNENSSDDFVLPKTDQSSVKRSLEVLSKSIADHDSEDEFDFSSLATSTRRKDLSRCNNVHDTPHAQMARLKRRHVEDQSTLSTKAFKSNEQCPMKAFKRVNSPMTSPQHPLLTNSIVVPQQKHYLNMIPDRYGDIRELLDSRSTAETTPSRKDQQSTTRSNANMFRLDDAGGEHELFAPVLNKLGMRMNSDNDLDYYLVNFLNILKSVLSIDEDYALFDDEDMVIVRNFYLLSCKAQKLYVRLFTRRYSWIAVTKMNYSEIDENLDPILQELCCHSFLEFDDNLTCLKTVLKLLGLPCLRELCRNLHLKVVPQKTALIDLILSHCRQQKSVVSGLDMLQAVTLDAKKLLKRCCRLLETSRRIFISICMLYSLTDTTNKHKDGPFQLETLLRVNMGQLAYPKYNVFRQAKIFRFRHDLIRYQTAYLLDDEISSAMESKDLETAERLCAIGVENFNNLLSDESITAHDAKLPTFLRKFTAGHLYILCLEYRVEILQKLDRYEEAVAQLESLIEQSIYCQRHKGHWMERVALNLDHHLNKPFEALRVIGRALHDPSLTEDHKLALHQRAMHISRSNKWRHLFKKKLVLPVPVIRKPPEVHIQGKKIDKSVPGYKTLFMATEFSESGSNFDVVLCSVEEFAICYYRSKGFHEGLHGEGSVLVTLFGLLFWDIIYQDGIADAFRCPHQTFPLDLYAEDFYLNRQVEIHKRVDFLRSSPMDDILHKMSETWRIHSGATSIVNWTLYNSFQQVQSLVSCMGTKFLAKVCLRFATNYRHYRGGIPDIVVWNPENGNWKMVEVKGPGDHLSYKQMLWLDYLLENEVSAEVCYVKAISGKEINKNGATAS